MASHKTEDIRNLALCGHSDTGKTTLAEAILFAAGAIPRKGAVNDGNTVADFEVEEKERGHSIDLAVLHADWKGRRINLLDAPGRPDFIGQGIEALSAVETAAIVVNAASGLGVNSRRMWIEAAKANLGRIVIVNKMDAENVDPSALLAKIREAFGDRVIPANLPIGHGPDFKGVVPTLTLPADIPGDMREEAEEVHKSLMEAVIEADDQLLERYLGGEEIAPDELSRGVAKAIRAGTVVPLLHVSAAKDLGVSELLEFIATTLPSPAGVLPRQGRRKDETVTLSSDGPLCAQVFKTMTDDYVGKISFLRVFSGELKAESFVLNVKTGKNEK
ncbi:MAG: GTP-binding protein, partial [Planctomycetes bacterium]|nr:GTP-binding protein [Planctomycetota bacterium]